MTAQARTVLSRDGAVIGETNGAGTGTFAVPADAGSYQLDVHASRPQYQLSPTIDASWTFPSAPVPAGEVEPLPLMTIRFGPVLNDRNQAEAGTAFDLPIWVDRQDSLREPRSVRLSLEVSYDDGARWANAAVIPTGAGWVARLTHPAPGVGTGYVSLRATANDGAGGCVRQTIIHAYRLAGAEEPQ